MSVTPQTNTTIEAIAEYLEAHDGYAICGHVSPDGDCLGSQLALACALKSMGKRVDVILAQAQSLERGLLFLPGVGDAKAAQDYAVNPDVCIALDTPTPERLGPAATVFHRAAQTVVIDHHAADVAMADLSYTDPAAPSTSMLIWKLIDAFGRDRFSAAELAQMAECVYTGLVTDTGRFSYQNVTSEAFIAAADMMACGANPQEVAKEVYQSRTVASLKLEARAIEHMELLDGDRAVVSWIDDEDMRASDAVRSDAESLIDVLRSLGDIEVACFLRNRNGQVRGSLRAKGDVDVAAIARAFGGGGHKAAAGFTLNMTLSEALERVRPTLLDAVRRNS